MSLLVAAALPPEWITAFHFSFTVSRLVLARKPRCRKCPRHMERPAREFADPGETG